MFAPTPLFGYCIHETECNTVLNLRMMEHESELLIRRRYKRYKHMCGFGLHCE